MKRPGGSCWSYAADGMLGVNLLQHGVLQYGVFCDAATYFVMQSHFRDATVYLSCFFG